MSIDWSRVYSASGFRDGVFSVCASSGMVYAVGFDEVPGPGLMRYRVESYRASSGERAGAWSDEKGYPYATLSSCSVLGDKLYVAGATSGFWSILEFNKDLKLGRRADFNEPCFNPFSMIALDNYLYLAGVLIENGYGKSIYVAKIDLSDLIMVKSREIKLNSSSTGAYVIEYDVKTNQLVLGGFTESNGEPEWLILYLSRELEPLKYLRPGFRNAITGLAVDYDGYIYAVDGARVVKLTVDGKVLAVSDNTPGVKIYAEKSKASPLRQYVIVASNDSIYILASRDLKTIASLKLPSEKPLQANPGRISSESNHVYLALTQIASRNNWNWAVYALGIKPQGLFARIFRKH
ncbi:MAG: hypothetical protein QXV54_02935 [Desulfurococcaceae archaeon]